MSRLSRPIPWFCYSATKPTNRLASLTLLMLLSLVLSQAEPRVQPHLIDQQNLAAHAKAAIRHAPLVFVQNVGQFARAARFALYGSSAGLMLADDGLWLTIHDRQSAPAASDQLAADPSARALQIKLSFVGANQHPQIEPLQRLDTRVAYFTGADPAAWRPDVPAWGGVRYRDLYPGVDLELSGAGGQLASRLVARQPADLQSVRMRVQGADDLALAGRALHLSTALGIFALPLPLAVTAGGAALPLGGLAPSLHGADIVNPFGSPSSAGIGAGLPGSNVQPQDAGDLVYSRLIGGNGLEEGGGVAVDSTGAAYVVGFTTSDPIPGSPGRLSTTPSGGYNATVIKLNQAGTSLDYVAIIGGAGIEYATGVAVDSDGAAYICGYTSSNDFPTTSGAFDTTGSGVNGSAREAFLFKLTPTAQLAYSTFIGGSGDERSTNVAVDADKFAYMTGMTPSTDFPTTPGALQETKAGSGSTTDAYVVKLNQTGSKLVYSTYLGGINDERGGDIKVDPNGAVYVTGRTSSANFPTTHSYGPIANASQNVFVTKIHPAGSSLIYSTLVGGKANDNGLGIAIDTIGAAYISGLTYSADFPVTPGAYDPTANGNQDVFAAKLDPSGMLTYATYLGGTEFDESTGIVVNANDQAYLVGFTQSSNFPKTADAYDPALNGTQDAFLAKLDSTGTSLLYGTFLGGDDFDSGDAIAIDSGGGVYLTGEAGPKNFPTTTGPAFGGGDNDAFVAKFQIDQAVVTPKYTISGTIRTPAPDNAPVAGITVSAGSRSTVTESDGTYRLTDLVAGEYTIAPSKPNATFSPPSYLVTVSADLAGKDFVLQTTLLRVSGRVIDGSSNEGLVGVTIADGSGGTTSTDARGRYTMSLAPGTYTLTPSRDKYIFTPPSRSVTLVSADIGDLEFLGTLIPPPKPQYVSIVLRTATAPPPPPPQCDSFEPNDNRATTTRTLLIGQSYQAKLCANDAEDNYIFTLGGAGKPIITLTLPDALREKTLVFVYNKANTSANATICGEGGLPKSAVITLTKCPFLPAGTSIVVRIYPNTDSDFDNQSPYTLLVTS